MTDDRPEACEVCHDSGWCTFECTGGQDCGRWRRHLPHTYATPCHCRPVNRVYQERQAQARRRVA